MLLRCKWSFDDVRRVLSNVEVPWNARSHARRPNSSYATEKQMTTSSSNERALFKRLHLLLLVAVRMHFVACSKPVERFRSPHLLKVGFTSKDQKIWCKASED
jgi:hypothetical protein